ncbi:MAG: hypothetical protein II360_03825 [Muribaculaceae bacterium]|nr:hypothetical protein [Muribaculaceae bacterium]
MRNPRHHRSPHIQPHNRLTGTYATRTAYPKAGPSQATTAQDFAVKLAAMDIIAFHYNGSQFLLTLSDKE